MAEKEAAVKLTLDASQFTSQMGEVGNKVATTAARGTASMRMLSAGTNAAKRSFVDLGNSAKRLLSTAVGLGSAFVFGSAIKGAVELDARMKDLAFRVKLATGQTVDSTAMQRRFEQAALATGRTTRDMADAFDTVFSATGDAKLSEAAMRSVGTAAMATGESVAALAEAAQLANRKFGVSAEQMDAALAGIVEKTAGGGKRLDDLGLRFSKMAGEAAGAGFKGAAGMTSLLGMLVDLDSKVGEVADIGLRGFFQQMKDGSSQVRAFEKAAKIKFDPDTTAFEKVQKILAGGPSTLGQFKQTLTGDIRTVFEEMIRPFEEEVGIARKGGASEQDATERGLKAFAERLDKAGRTSVSAADLAAQAAKRAEDPQARLRQAFERVQQAVAQPAMIEAIDSLTASLPAVAKVFADLVSFAAKNPLLAGAIGIGGKVGGAFLGGAMLEVLKGHTAGGKVAGEEVAAGHAAGGRAAAKTVGASGGAFGKVAGAAIAGAIAFAITKEQVDRVFDEDAKRQGDSAATGAGAAAAAAGGNVGKQKEALAALDAQIASERKSLGDFSFDNVLKGTVGAFAKVGAATGIVDDVKDPFQQAGERIEAMTNQRNELALSIRKREILGEPEAGGGGEAGGSGKREQKPLKLDPSAPRAVGDAVGAALGGKVLKVEITNAKDLIPGAVPLPGSGTRGALVPPPPAPGSSG